MAQLAQDFNLQVINGWQGQQVNYSEYEDFLLIGNRKLPDILY